MAKAGRERRERTDNWELIQQWCRHPEQRLYESIRPITLFGIPPAERAQEVGLAESTLRRTADTFDSLGMASLFRPTKQQREDHHRSLPAPMRQLIVDLKAEYPDFSLREIADICYVQFDRRPSHNTVKQVLADGPPPSRTTRQYPYYADIADWLGGQIACQYESAAYRGFTDPPHDLQEARGEPFTGRIPHAWGVTPVRHPGESTHLWPHHGRESAVVWTHQATG